MYSKYDDTQTILEAYRHQLFRPNPKWREKVRETVVYIHEHLFDSELTVERLQEACHISSKEFPGIFRYYIGCSPQEYWLKLRIEASKLLLRDKRLKNVRILTIALEVGFNSQPAFTQTFKKLVGITPGKWRSGKNN
jgi:AraC family transcriptional regulator